ncbi:gastrin-releasing peptide receptor-like [Periplaneta americana]|uniref:gastrin-releasing peptide receptor-like n=1 Tax=Periplaneta americana TaxID=6978 RepID=UPI0037E85161
MSVFLFHLLGLLSFLVCVPTEAVPDEGEATTKTFVNSSCPVEIIHTVSPYWTSNYTDGGELEKALQDIVEVIALQEQTLNSLLLNVSNFNQTEEQTAMNQKEVFPKLMSDLVKLSHEEEDVLPHHNQSHYDEVGNNDTEEYEKYLRIIRDKTQHMDHMVNILEINLQLFEPDVGLTKEIKNNNTSEVNSVRCVIDKYRSCIKLLNCTIEDMSEVLNVEYFLEFRMKFHLLCHRLCDDETLNDHNDGKSKSDVLFLTMGIIFFILGVIGNSVLLLIFSRHKEMRTAPNLIILNLTITDMLDLLCNFLLFYLSQFNEYFVFGTIMCHMYLLVCYTVVYASIYSVLAMYVQRCVVLTRISNPQASSRPTRRKLYCALMLIIVWVISIILAIYPLGYTITNKGCGTDWDNRDFMRTFRLRELILIFVIPFIVIAISSCLTARVLNRSIPGESIGLEEVRRGRVLSSKVVIALTFVFTFSYGTHNVLLCINEYLIDTPNKLRLTIYITYILTFTDACFNPIALFVTSSIFRRYMKKYLLFWKSSSYAKINAVTHTANARIQNTGV